jgi:hypothetical protein
MAGGLGRSCSRERERFYNSHGLIRRILSGDFTGSTRGDIMTALPVSNRIPATASQSTCLFEALRG